MQSINARNHDAWPVVDLRDATRVRIRPLAAGDEAVLADTFRRLNSETRYRRCFHIKRELAPDELRTLCAADGVEHIALGALLLDENDVEIEGVGGAQCIRSEHAADAAEVAFVVADVLLKRGLDHML